MTRDRPSAGGQDSSFEGEFGFSNDRAIPLVQQNSLQVEVNGAVVDSAGFSGRYAAETNMFPNFNSPTQISPVTGSLTFSHSVDLSTGIIGGTFYDNILFINANSATQDTTFNVYVEIDGHETLPGKQYAFFSGGYYRPFGSYPTNKLRFTEERSVSAGSPLFLSLHWGGIGGLIPAYPPFIYDLNVLPTLYPGEIYIKAGITDFQASLTGGNMYFLNTFRSVNLSPLIR